VIRATIRDTATKAAARGWPVTPGMVAARCRTADGRDVDPGLVPRCAR
jgi:hypothetical protein